MGYPIPRKNSDTGDKKSPGFWDFRDFLLGIFSGFCNPDPWDFGIFGIFHLRFFRDFEIPIPIPGISGFFGVCNRAFFGVFRGLKIPIPIPGIFGFSEFFNRDFSLGIFSGFCNPDSDPDP